MKIGDKVLLLHTRYEEDFGCEWEETILIDTSYLLDYVIRNIENVKQIN